MLQELVFPRSKVHRAKGVPIRNDEEGQTVVFVPGTEPPSLLQDAVFDMDASRDLVSYSVDDTVATVTDRLGNLYTATPTGIRHGLFTSITGLLVYRFGQFDNAYMDTPGVLLPQPFTVFVMGRGFIESQPDTFFDSRPTGPRCLLRTDLSEAYADAGTVLLNSAYDFSWHVFELTFNGDNSAISVDKVRVRGAVGANSLLPLRVGNNSGASDSLYGEIGQLAVVPGAHSEGRRNKVIDELTAKWITG